MPEVDAVNSFWSSREVIAAVIGGTIGLLGVALGGWLTYLCAIRIQEAARLDAAKDEFRKVIVPSLVQIQARIGGTPCFDLVDDRFTHLIAYHHFRRALAHRERDRFDKAWREYYETTDDCFPNQYNPDGDDDVTRDRIYKLAEARMEELLKFTL